MEKRYSIRFTVEDAINIDSIRRKFGYQIKTSDAIRYALHYTAENLPMIIKQKD